MRKIKQIALSEIIMMIVAIVSFSYLVGSTLPTVEANAFLPTGCCLETKSGSSCINFLEVDAGLCDGGLIPSQCEAVNDCKPGCCYDSNGGSCTLNAPKAPCEANGGEWLESDTCSIPQCQIGCCVLGSQAIPATTRECTQLSAEYGFEKEFQSMDNSGYCEAYNNPSEKGACTADSGDFSGEKDCIFTERANCNGDFNVGKLCTALDLGTLCVPSKDTTCIEGTDQVYFLDSCGNQANVYDSARAADQTYWEDVIAPKSSCSGSPKDCGNCDYAKGSICTPKNVTDIQPTYGDFICRDLNCDNGMTHGESWCVYDHDVNKIAPVGSRSFVATCLEGDVNLEGCADFNQEVCIQGQSGSTTIAKCYPNDWRSCINANGRGDYNLVKNACEQMPQCQMFNDYHGEENVKESQGNYLAGFDPNVANEDQGAAGDVGKDGNRIIPYCIPKYTPGFQFWNSEQVPGSISTNIGSGGSAVETNAICSLGSFTCTSRMERDCTLATGCGTWDDRENWECNINGRSQNIRTQDLPKLMAAMNERCRAIGTCGTNVGIAGAVGFDEGYTLSRIKINKQGEQEDNISVLGYNLTSEQLANIVSSVGLIKAGTMSEVPVSSGLVGEDGLGIGEAVSASTITAQQIVSQASGTYSEDSDLGAILGIGSGIGILALQLADTGAIGIAFEAVTEGGTLLGSWNAGAAVYAAAIIVVFAYLGYQIGNLIGENQNWSPQKAAQFNLLFTGLGTAVGAGVVAWVYGLSWIPIVGWIIAALIAIFSLFSEFKETQYYILRFNCEGWEPNRGGDCNACNEDVRPCSEYRCRTIGSNCRYYTDLGEPGTCASVSETWQAVIDPWQEVLTENNQYTSVGQGGFVIQGSGSDGKVKSWEPLTFGIETDKDALCKIDTVHTDDYTSMANEMAKTDNRHHYVTLSQFGEQGTLLMETGENNYYIRCMNFAGEINEAEFAVQLELSDDPDVTPPRIISYDPVNNGYLKYGGNSTTLTISMSEPSECKINDGFDSSFENMENNMTCITNPRLGFLGEWPCIYQLENLVNNQNEFFIKCLDKPGTAGEEGQRMLSQTYTYQIEKCSEGLEITSISPSTTEIVSNSAGEIALGVQTQGCVRNGESTCYYNFGGGDILFLETNSTSHRQVFNTLGSGDYNIGIHCIDPAGNEDTKQKNITVRIDQSPPVISKLYINDNTLTVRTNEPARCAIQEANETSECEIEINTGNPLQSLNTFQVTPSKEYFVNCQDEFENENAFCEKVRILN